MKSFLLIGALWMCLIPTVAAQSGAVTGDIVLKEAVPGSVIAEAVAAVQQVGNEALQENYEEVIAKIYPRYRKRAVKQLGGEAALVAQMRKMISDLKQGGITILSFKAEPAIQGFEIPEFGQWLVFVPTTRVIRRIDTQTGQVKKGELTDYQVALRDKAEGSEWSFINGSTLKVSELRALFPSLPRDEDELALPPTGFRDLP